MRIIVIGVLLLGMYPAAWIAASVGWLKNVEFGYYGEFNTARHAIETCGCAEKIEYSGVNKDIVLEEFHFKVTTKRGRVVRLWFDGSNMDVGQVCYLPVGISVHHPAFSGDRRYSPDFLTGLLKDRGIKIQNLKDILCNIELLDVIFGTTPGDAEALRETDPYVWDYLRLELPTEDELKKGWRYTDVKEKDVVDWP